MKHFTVIFSQLYIIMMQTAKPHQFNKDSSEKSLFKIQIHIECSEKVDTLGFYEY